MTVGKSSRCTRWDIDFGNSLRKSVDAMLRLDSTSAFIEALSISALIHSCVCREVSGTKTRFSVRLQPLRAITQQRMSPKLFESFGGNSIWSVGGLRRERSTTFGRCTDRS